MKNQKDEIVEPGAAASLGADAAPTSATTPKAVERVTLTSESADRVNAWLKQLEESSKGFLQLTKSDLVNYIISERKIDLSAREMQQIRQSHYDPVRHLNWITPRLKSALEQGDLKMVQALQAELKGIELTFVTAAGEPSHWLAEPKPRKRRKSSKEVEGSIVENADPI